MEKIRKLELKGDFDLQKPVYRYVKYNHLTKFLRSKNYWISNIKLWEDPYEKYFSKCNMLDENGCKIDIYELPHYGQSWTINKESDAMWRIYSQINRKKEGQLIDNETLGVRVMTLPSILQGLTQYIQNFNLGYLGPVNYKSQRNIEREVKNFQGNMGQYWNKWEMEFFTKREDFQHENEFRLIFSILDQGKELKGISVPIEPSDILKEITFDPRLRDEDYEMLKQDLVGLGYPPELINKSKLYHFKPHTITIIR